MNDFFKRLQNAMEQIVNEEEQNKQKQSYKEQSYQNNTFYNQKPQKPTEDYRKQDFFNFEDTRRSNNHFNNNFINQDFFNMNDMRSDGNKTNRFDLDKPNTNWKKTSYSTQEGLTTTAIGVNVLKDKNVKLNGNAYQWKDEDYGYCDIYAVNIDQVKEHGKGKASVYNSDIYGSVIEVTDSNGKKSNGIILDACGEASKKAIIDKFTKNTELNNEFVTWEVKRFGFKDDKQDPRKRR